MKTRRRLCFLKMSEFSSNQSFGWKVIVHNVVIAGKRSLWLQREPKSILVFNDGYRFGGFTPSVFTLDRYNGRAIGLLNHLSGVGVV